MMFSTWRFALSWVSAGSSNRGGEARKNFAKHKDFAQAVRVSI
jgi:hypothetical protein